MHLFGRRRRQVSGTLPSAVPRSPGSAGTIYAPNLVVAGLIDGYNCESLDGRRHGTTYNGPSTLSSWCEMVDDSVLDQMFSISRSFCSALLDCPK